MAQTAEAGVARGETRTLALIGAGHFLSHFYALSLPPLFGYFREEFGASYALLGALVTGYAVVGGVLQAPVGLAVDRWGARPVLRALRSTPPPLPPSGSFPATGRWRC